MSVNVHVIQAVTDPVAAPNFVGQHWINTVTSKHFLAAGTSVVGDWKEIIDAPFAFAVPVTQNPDQSNTEGVASTAARSDHVHNIPADVAVGLDTNSTSTEGASTSFARANHTHAIASGTPSAQAPDQANAAGTSANFAKADHIHNIPCAAPTTTLSPAVSNAEGTGVSFARNDHTHAVATALVGDITTIEPDAAASAGTANTYARGDHRHAIVAAAPSSVGTANSEGVSTSFARADHVHDHGAQTSGTLHAAATTSVAGFMSAADKTEFDKKIFGFLSYSNTSTQTTTQNNTGWATLTMDLNQDSFANGLLTKSSATQFRADFDGYVEIHYKAEIQNTSSNNRAMRMSVAKNGTALKRCQTRTLTQTNTERYSSVSSSNIIPCSNGDLFTLVYSNAEAVTDTVQVAAEDANMTVIARRNT